MTRIEITPPAAFINANKRLHFHTKNDLTQAWRKAAKVAADGAPSYGHAHITVTYRFPTNHRREVANLQPTSKAIVDGLVDAGLIPDDSDDYVTGPDNRRERPNGPPRVVVEIRELTTDLGDAA